MGLGIAEVGRSNSLRWLFRPFAFAPSTIATMADEKRSTPTPSRTPPPGEPKEAPISSSSSAMQNRSRNGGILARSHLAGLLRVKLGAGIVRDIRARAPWYWSDWKDAWNYRVLPATALVFFAK
jgi:hypothetical protein